MQSSGGFRDSDQIVVLDPDGTVRALRGPILPALGWTEAGMVGRPYVDLVVAPPDRARVREDIQRVLAGQETFGFVNAVLGPSGARRLVRWRAFSFDCEGTTHLMAIGEDLSVVGPWMPGSDRDEVRGALTAAAVHDANNFLFVAMGHVDFLEDANLTGEEREALEGLSLALERLRKLMRSTLRAARGGAGEVVDLTEHLGLTRTALRHLVQPHALEVETPTTPLPVAIDALSLDQVLFNLLANARDAMPDAGEIGLAVRLRAEAVDLEVRDTGPGIDPEIQDRLFEPFVTSKGDDGTGLGLAIVRRLVEGAGGQVVCRSTVGEGTTFTVTLPLAGRQSDA